jgi:hypothetical protein
VPSEPKRGLPSGSSAKRAVVPGLPGAGGRMTRFFGVGFSMPVEIPLWRLLCRGARIVVFIYGPLFPVVRNLRLLCRRRRRGEHRRLLSPVLLRSTRVLGRAGGANRTFVLLSSKQHLKGTPSKKCFQEPICLPERKMLAARSVFVLRMNSSIFSFWY